MNPSKQIRLAGSVLGRLRHSCAFFNCKEEGYHVLLPFIKEGFQQGDRALHIVDHRNRAEHIRRLEAAGIDIQEAERRDQLEVRPWEDAYLQEGHFDQNRQIALIESVLQLRGQADGRQVPDAKLGVASGSGGMASYMGTVILGSERP